MDKELFKPSNLSNLTDEEVAQMQNLTVEEVKELAEAFPNDNGKTYLILKDNSQQAKNQLYPASTWPNLAELHRLGKTNYVALAPSKDFRRKAEVSEAPAQDLTSSQAKDELRSLNTRKTKETPATAPEQTGIPLDQMTLEQLRERYEDVNGEDAGELDEDFLRTALAQDAVKEDETKDYKTAPGKTAPKKTAAKKAAAKKAAPKKAGK